MARPAKVAPASLDLPPGLAGFVAGSDATPPATDFIPSSVTGAWDDLRNTLGRTVPHNVNEARASAKRLRRLG